MSIEYTIDIQLTELGFPDVLHTRETSVRETPCRSTSSDGTASPSHPHATRRSTHGSTPHKRRLLGRGQQSADGKVAKQTAAVVTASPLLCQAPNPAQSLQDKANTTHPEHSDSMVIDLTSGPSATDLPLPITGHDGKKGKEGAQEQDSTEALKDVQEDSSDSDVSVVYEEEEEEEDDEDEEGLNNESSHSGDYRCSYCDLQLPSKFKLQDHMNLHTGARPYCCAECGKRFCQIHSYRVHLRTHAQTKVEHNQCRICLRVFVSQGDLKYHLSITHFETEFYECDLCKLVFTSMQACRFHVQSHGHMPNGEVCGNLPSPKSLARHQRRRQCGRSYKCMDCTNTYTKKNALLKHSFSHLGLLPYTCVRCRCHFRLAKLYRLHRCEPDRIHCVACLRVFHNQEDFERHKKDTGCWGNQEPKGDEIRCLECGQMFDTTEELKKHAGAHQRVLKCAECGKGFRSALLLMSHMGGHAGISPCLCQSCGLGFPHQQNYDGHLKTCGQTPQPVSVPKKRHATKGSSSEMKKVNALPDSFETKKVNAEPDSSHLTSAFTSKPDAAPVKECRSPGPVPTVESNGSGPSDGLWKLTLNKQPPPGVKLLLFLPVSPSQTDVPSGVSESAMQLQPQAALTPVSNEHLGVNCASGVLQNVPLDLVTKSKQDKECEAPLDLSKKCNTSLSAPSDTPLLPVKSEPEEFESSEEADGTAIPTFKTRDSKVTVKSNPRETDTCNKVKQCKHDPMDLSTLHFNTTSSGLIMDIKEELPSPGRDLDLCSSRSDQLTEKETKM